MTRRLTAAFAVMCVMMLVSCNKIEDTRIPYYPVTIKLNSLGLWNTYGVTGYGQYRKFIKEKGLPSNFAYTATTYTGFGGVLLISGYDFTTQNYNSPIAYDLSCPVEAKSNVRIEVDATNYEAYCPTCGSRYNVTEGGGIPISGAALEKQYGLTRYSVISQSSGGYIITR